MKRSIILLGTGFLLSAFLLGGLIEDVAGTLGKGDASQLSGFLDQTVEITLHQKSNSYSRNQAQVVLRDFFQLHQVRRFDVLHRGENVGSRFCIGMLHTRTGDFRTTLFMKQRADRMLIQEIRFEIGK